MKNQTGPFLLKTYFRYLTHEDPVRCQMELEKGQVRKLVTQHEILVQGEWAIVVLQAAKDIERGYSPVVQSKQLNTRR